jgi:hypothetical protein
MEPSPGHLLFYKGKPGIKEKIKFFTPALEPLGRQEMAQFM